MSNYILHVYLQLKCIPSTNSIHVSNNPPIIGQPVVAIGWRLNKNETNTLKKTELLLGNNSTAVNNRLIVRSGFCGNLPINIWDINVCNSGGPIIQRKSDGGIHLVGILIYESTHYQNSKHYADILKMSLIAKNWIPVLTSSSIKRCVSGGCFPPNSKVLLLETNFTATVSSLKPGDRVLAMSSQNQPIFTEFLSFIHSDQKKTSQYL